ncbi:MAG: hypothetical protein Q9209_005493 [Squamulea sp. 1 TL-2023]
MSSPPSNFSGVGTGEEASFPSATYLRKRYKKLQRCIVSRIPSSWAASRHANSAQTLDDQDTPPVDYQDPSFQAIRALNGQPNARPEPDVIQAIINDLNGNTLGADESATSTPAREVKTTHEHLASTSHDPQSFSARVDRLMQAVDRREHIRFEPAEESENVDFFVNIGNGSETSSPRSVTDQIGAYPENSGHIIDPGHITQRLESLSSADRFFCPRTFTGRRDSVRIPDSVEPISVLGDIGFTRVRVGSPIITETRRRELEQRIRVKIEASGCGSPEPPSRNAARLSSRVKNSDDISTTNVGYSHRKKTVDPRRLYTISRDNQEECCTISPILLEYQKGHNFATPSLDSRRSSSGLSSPLNHKSKRALLGTRRVLHSDHSLLSGSPVATTDAWFSEDSDQSSWTKQEGEQFQLKQEQRSERILSWLNCVKDALLEHKKSPAKKLGRAVNVFREGPARTVGKSAVKGTPSGDRALKDVTNVRQPAYLQSNSFAQEKIRQERFMARLARQKEPRPAVTRMDAVQHPAVDSPNYAAASSWESSQSSTMKQDNEEELHPEVAYTLARLEGRVAPRSASPFPIRRSRDDFAPHSSDVEVEILPLSLVSPQPLRPDHESIVGNWTAPMEEAAEAGFECVLEPPEETS